MMRKGMLCGSLALLVLAAAASSRPPVAKNRPVPLLTLRGHTGRVLCVRYSPDGKRLATASEDRTAALWDAAAGKKQWTLTGHAGAVRHLAFTPDGSRLLTASDDGTVTVWDAATGGTVRTLAEYNAIGYAVAFSPDGSRLAWARHVDRLTADGGGVRIRDAGTGREVAALRGLSRGVPSLAYSPDGRRLASGDFDIGVTVWEAASGGAALHLRSPPDQLMGVSALAFSPDGRRLATATSNGTIVVWHLASGKASLVPESPFCLVHCLAFSPDGKHLAAASTWDPRLEGAQTVGELRLWDAKTGREEAALREVERGLYGACFSPCGTRLATAHGDGTVKVWSVKQLLGQAR
jgi:WD40 repeat protein